MPTYGLSMPSLPEEDHAQALRDQREAYVRQALQWEQIRQDVLETLALAWLEREGRLGVIVDQLTDAPIRDRFDLEGYLRHCGARDAEALGRQVMTLLAQTVLAHVEALDHHTPF